MHQFETAYFITIGLLVATVWALVIADTIGPGIRRIARSAGRAVVRLLTRNPKD
jgi:hypothetical protein